MRTSPLNGRPIGARIAEIVSGRFAFSRALAPDLRADLLGTGLGTELPALDGETVIPTGWDLPVVLGHPNHFGRFEPAARPGDILLAGRWSSLQAAPPGTQVVAEETPVPQAVAARLRAAAVTLAKRIEQHAGVRVPYAPRTPIVIALLPGRIAGARPSGVTEFGAHHPEYPGGMRIELPADADTEAIVRYAGAIERWLSKET